MDVRCAWRLLNDIVVRGRLKWVNNNINNLFQQELTADERLINAPADKGHRPVAYINSGGYSLVIETRFLRRVYALKLTPKKIYNK